MMWDWFYLSWRVNLVKLNDGLRPHLIRWQARFRHWYATQEDAAAPQSPQDLQLKFPEHDELLQDLLMVNAQLVQYASELSKIVDG